MVRMAKNIDLPTEDEVIFSKASGGATRNDSLLTFRLVYLLSQYPKGVAVRGADHLLRCICMASISGTSSSPHASFWLSALLLSTHALHAMRCVLKAIHQSGWKRWRHI